MNTLIAGFLLFSLALVAQAQQRGSGGFEADHAKAAEQMARACQAQEKATEADIREFQQQRKPTSHSAKCLHACLMESIGLIEDGKLSVKNSVEFVGQMTRGNAELKKIIEEISTECLAVKEDDRCEFAFKIMICTEEGMRKRRVDMRKYLPQRPQ